MENFISENFGLVASIAGGLLVILLIIILELKSKINKERKIKKDYEKRLRRLRESHEFMMKELTSRIDELNMLFSKRKRIIQAVLNLAGALSELTEKEEIIELLTEQVKNIINANDVYYFNAVEGGFKLVLYKHKSFEDKELLGRGALVYNFGEGPIGYAAKKRFTMDKDTMYQDALVEGIPETQLTDPFGINYEIISPLFHRERLFGVLAVSGIKQEKIEGVVYEESKEEALRAAMETVQMISELGALALRSAELMEKIQRMADTDGLTEIYNKRYFMEKLQEILENAKKDGFQVGLFLMDIDYFKKYNDTNGHPKGDLLLKSIAKILKKTAETAKGIPARYGGEEFVVILPKKNKIESLRYGEMVRQIIERTKFPHEEKQPG